MPRSDLHLTSSYVRPRLCLLYLFRSDRQYLQTYVRRDKFQLSSGRLHLCLNLHSVKHTSTVADNPVIQPRNTIITSCGVGSSEPWSFHNMVVWERRQSIPSVKTEQWSSNPRHEEKGLAGPQTRRVAATHWVWDTQLPSSKPQVITLTFLTSLPILVATRNLYQNQNKVQALFHG
jgi:hypothetical protein